MAKPAPTAETDGRLTERLEAAMEDADRLLELRLQHCPYEWKSALIDVFDTYDACGLKLLSKQGFVYAEDAIALTRLVMERKALDESRALEEAKAESQEDAK